ncbi:hypothetical protein [Mesomycoplasma neurolyticum]|uniref:DUF31 domain-containing protein n=1 Tax=Mesomycoplasma neurolyticum TaxID=2120 RepID=A0A449A5M1_9BACT|nr:hypothetical protein [Mesomycoplasma neurolyticum]VEU59536.1 Uncharacterised protein [Mesomycoplasma neurolyticum]
MIYSKKIKMILLLSTIGTLTVIGISTPLVIKLKKPAIKTIELKVEENNKYKINQKYFSKDSEIFLIKFEDIQEPIQSQNGYFILTSLKPGAYKIEKIYNNNNEIIFIENNLKIIHIKKKEEKIKKDDSKIIEDKKEYKKSPNDVSDLEKTIPKEMKKQEQNSSTEIIDNGQNLNLQKEKDKNIITESKTKESIPPIENLDDNKNENEKKQETIINSKDTNNNKIINNEKNVPEKKEIEKTDPKKDVLQNDQNVDSENILKTNPQNIFINEVVLFKNDTQAKNTLVFLLNKNELNDKWDNKICFKIKNKEFAKEFKIWEKNIFIELKDINDEIDNLEEINNLKINNILINNLNNIKFTKVNNSTTAEITDLDLNDEEFEFEKSSANLIIKLKNKNLNLKENQKLILHFKPLQNNEEFSVKYISTYSQNKIIVKDIDWISNFYQTFYLTNIYTSDLKTNYSIPEFLKFELRKKYEITINRIQKGRGPSKEIQSAFTKNDDFINSYNFKVAINLNENELFYNNKYFSLTFENTENQKQNIRKIFNYKEFKEGFTINNLPEGNNWKLKQIDLLQKENLQFIKSLYKSKKWINEVDNNISSWKEEPLKFEILDQDLNLNSDIKLNFENSISQIGNSNPKLNKENYLNTNKNYLKKTQTGLFCVECNKKENIDSNLKNVEINLMDNIIFYDWKILFETFKEKQYKISDDKKTYEIRKKMNLFDDSEFKNLLINFNFFANYNFVDIYNWQYNHNSYSITFSLEELKEKNKIENIEIDLIVNSENVDNKKIINQRLKASVEIDNDEIVFKIQARKGVLNKDIYIHNLTNEISTFVELNQNYISMMYWSEKAIFKDTSALVSKSNNWDFKTQRNDDTSLKKYKFDVNEKFTKNNEDDIIKKVKARAFGNKFGSLWMIAKVNDDVNDHRYYIGTNKHVHIIPKTTLAIPKTHENDEDINAIFNKDKEWSLKSFTFWEATNNMVIDGTNEQKAHKDGADLQVGIIDISELVEYYENNKTKDNKEKDVNFLIAEHFYKWRDLPDLKISQKIKHIKVNTIFDSYISAFPNDHDQPLSGAQEKNKDNFFVRNNLQLKMKFGDLLSIGGNFGYETSDNIGMYHETTGIWEAKKNNLLAGSSGSGVYDDEGNIYGLHMGHEKDKWQTVLISNPRLDLFGSYNEFNDKSFASKVQLANRLYPEKYKKIQTFDNFVNPLLK